MCHSVAADVDDRGPLRVDGPHYDVGQVVEPVCPETQDAEGLCQRDKVGVAQVGPDDAAGESALPLVVLRRAEFAVVEDERHQVYVVLRPRSRGRPRRT